MITIENITTKNTVFDCKPSYSLEMDFESIIFDEDFKNVPSRNIIPNKNFQVEISKNFRIPEINYYGSDKYAFTFYEDLEFMDKFAPIPDNKEIVKLSRKPQEKPEITISKENFVIPMVNYDYDQYDTLFMEDLEFLDKYASLDNVDDCFLSNLQSNDKKAVFTEVVEEKPVIIAEKIERITPSVIVSKPSDKFSSFNNFSEKRNLDRILRN